MPPTPSTPLRIFLLVTAGATFGLIAGGAFGYWAASSAPGFFIKFLETTDTPTQSQALGMGTMLGAFGGLLSGALLAAFSVFIPAALMFSANLRRRSECDKKN